MEIKGCNCSELQSSFNKVLILLMSLGVSLTALIRLSRDNIDIGEWIKPVVGNFTA